MRQVKLANPDNTSWRIARGCNAGTCVQVALDEEPILLGDSKDPDGPVVSCTRLQYMEFIARIKTGYYDSVIT
jgi:hypothetical protein